MKEIRCEMCGSNDLVKNGELFVCQYCGAKYTVEEARKLMVEGTVKIDNSDFVQKYLANARRALEKEDWEEVEKYYNMVEQNAPHNMEAVFFSSYGKAMAAMLDNEFFKREQKFNVLEKSISVINEYFEDTDEDKEAVIRKIDKYMKKMESVKFLYMTGYRSGTPGSFDWGKSLVNRIQRAFKTELKQIYQAHPELGYIKELLGISASPNSSPINYTGSSVSMSFAILAIVFAGVSAFFGLIGISVGDASEVAPLIVLQILAAIVSLTMALIGMPKYDKASRTAGKILCGVSFGVLALSLIFLIIAASL